MKAEGQAKSFTLSMQFSSSCCMFPPSPSRGQISRAIKAAFLFASAFSNNNSCFLCFLLQRLGQLGGRNLPSFTLQIKLPHGSITSYQNLHQQWESSQKIAGKNKECMWVIRKSYPACNLQNQSEMKQLQESKVFAKLPAISWSISNCLKWQLLTA